MINLNKIVTICIPVFNGGEKIEVLLESILKDKKYLNSIEIIISDNCSQDNTLNIVNKYIKVLPIKLYKQEKNIGFSRNFQFCGNLATAEYITFMGADDKVSSLENLIDMALWMKRKRISLASSNFNIFNESGAITKIALFRKENYIYERDGDEDIGELWIESALASIGGWVVRRNEKLFQNINSETIYPEYYVGMNSLIIDNSYGIYSKDFYSQYLSDSIDQLANLQYTNIKYFEDFYSITKKFIKYIKCSNIESLLSKKILNNVIPLYAYSSDKKQIFRFLYEIKAFKYLNFKHIFYLIIIITIRRKIVLELLKKYRAYNDKNAV